MLSKEQEKEKIRRILLTVQSFLETDCQSIEELSKEIGIPSSSIQRYLKEEKIIAIYFGEEINELIEEKLRVNKEIGTIKGGVTSALNNISTKDSHGKFTGSRKR